MPTCQHTMSVTVSGPFTIGPTMSPSLTSSHHRGSPPRDCSDCVLLLDHVDFVVGIGGEFDRVVLLAFACLLAFGADHQSVLRGQKVVVVAEDLARPFVNGPLCELARLVEHTDKGVSAVDASTCTQWRPPFACTCRVERMDATQWIALHEVALVLGDLGDFVLTDQRVTADQRRGCDRTTPHGCRGIVGIAPQRVVVPVRLGDVAEGVDGRHEVVRRHRMWLRHANASANRSMASSVMAGVSPTSRIITRE